MNTNIHSKLVEFGKEILYKNSLPEGLPLISKYAKDIIGAERCSMFIYNPTKQELWTTLADGVQRIVIPSDKGIVGETLKTKKVILENEVHSNPNFLYKIDKETGYTTSNVATAPIFNSNKDIVGVLQLINKDGGFEDRDIKYMTFFAHSLSNFIDLINLYEEKDKK
ncbi:MAG: GAF domain-containing protein [Sulfurimonas sp.]|nr:GAF domain-containing protein [Sulfurimonas sp.]